MVDKLRTVWQIGAGWSFQSRSLDLAVFTVGTDLPLRKVLKISPDLRVPQRTSELWRDLEVCMFPPRTRARVLNKYS